MVTERDALSDASRCLFGQDYLLALMLYVGRSSTGLVSQKECWKALDLESPSSIQRPWRVLVESGLLVPTPHVGADRTKYFARISSLTWDWAEEIAGTAAHAGEAAAAPPARDKP